MGAVVRDAEVQPLCGFLPQLLEASTRVMAQTRNTPTHITLHHTVPLSGGTTALLLTLHPVVSGTAKRLWGGTQCAHYRSDSVPSAASAHRCVHSAWGCPPCARCVSTAVTRATFVARGLARELLCRHQSRHTSHSELRGRKGAPHVVDDGSATHCVCFPFPCWLVLPWGGHDVWVATEPATLRDCVRCGVHRRWYVGWQLASAIPQPVPSRCCLWWSALPSARSIHATCSNAQARGECTS